MCISTGCTSRSWVVHTTQEQVSEEPISHQGDPYEVGSGPEFGSSELKCKSHEEIKASSANTSQLKGAKHKQSYQR